MQVGHCLACRRPLIDDKAIALSQPFLLSDILGRIQDVQVVPCVGKVGQARNLGPGHDQDVGGRHGSDVSKGEDVLVLIDDGRGNFALDDSSEESGHSLKVACRCVAGVRSRVRRGIVLIKGRILVWLSGAAILLLLQGRSVFLRNSFLHN